MLRIECGCGKTLKVADEAVGKKVTVEMTVQSAKDRLKKRGEIYLDSEARPIATTRAPKLERGQVAFLSVTECTRHGAFVRLPLLSGGDDDGACLIEPSVRCNHCGYCQSFGH